ncbi:hypothetical protein HPB50_021899 [Hyalomma asiaticum]|uniref:Uncharacterized protein n=1 Tax=Hyalomma asiaticum TaxID=266040 RepID=A0ACB7SY97_HYAAI|nr:hypothetical protein HPB50_021899 [Hyalomma asiaticum]
MQLDTQESEPIRQFVSLYKPATWIQALLTNRASEESLASADDSIDETHSVMSFIMSRLPDHVSIVSEMIDVAPSGSVVAGGATASTTTLAYGAPGGDGAPAPPPPFPVEVRKRQIRWIALTAYLPRLLRLLLFLVAHAILLVAFVEVGWDKNVRYDSNGRQLLSPRLIHTSGCCTDRETICDR